MSVLINRYRRYRRDSKLQKLRQERLRFGIRKMLGGVLGSFVLSFFLVFCHDLIVQWDYFQATHVDIRGNSRLSDADILEISQIGKTPNILAVNRLIAQKRLCDQPWIVTAEVIRELPNRLTIHIQEHQPVAVLEIETRYLMDGAGQIFKEADETECAGLPLVSGLDLTDLNRHDPSEATAFSAVLTVLKMGKEENALIPNRNIHQICVDRDVGVTLVVREGIRSMKIDRISLGLTDFDQKYKSLDLMIGYLKKTHMTEAVAHIDLTDTRRIVVRPAVPDTVLADNHKEDV
ncbi:MAG: cell division protein FtsQ/DivIB [Desulfatirhabdiaceae bacterium]